jgi:hypothetical protein
MFSKLPSTSMSAMRKVANIRTITRNMAVSFEGYGQHLFKGAVAAPYLQKVGLPANTLDSNAWTTNGNADKVNKYCNTAAAYCQFHPRVST